MPEIVLLVGPRVCCTIEWGLIGVKKPQTFWPPNEIWQNLRCCMSAAIHLPGLSELLSLYALHPDSVTALALGSWIWEPSLVSFSPLAFSSPRASDLNWEFFHIGSGLRRKLHAKHSLPFLARGLQLRKTTGALVCPGFGGLRGRKRLLLYFFLHLPCKVAVAEDRNIGRQ